MKIDELSDEDKVEAYLIAIAAVEGNSEQEIEKIKNLDQNRRLDILQASSELLNPELREEENDDC